MTDDIIRLKAEYASREQRLVGDDRYSFMSPAYLFMRHQRQRVETSLLKKLMVDRAEKVKVLEVGCGRGGILQEYLLYQLISLHCYGTDLLPERIIDAHRLLSHVPFSCSNAQFLPYRQASFDLVTQYTVFSSILDEQIKNNIAQEMLRVLKPDGTIIWYDFWVNPTNKQTRGIPPKEVRQLFPNCRCEFHKVTLAPPIARILVPFSWELSVIVEALKILNSHYFALVSPIH